MTELNQENNGYSAMIHGKVYNPAQLVDRILELEEENEHIKDLKKENEDFSNQILDYIEMNNRMMREKDELAVSAVAAKEKNKLLEIENEKLKKELSLEKAASEAQHKFIREYAGKGTEVQFNYAIDDAKEVSYVIVDKEEYNKNFEKWANAQVEQDCHKNTREYILDQAKKCVCGHREQDYGTPESNFQLIADLWNGYLGFMDHPQDQIRATDVAMMMALMKIARIRNGGGSGDSFVDLAGYAACGGEIWHGERHSDK